MKSDILKAISDKMKKRDKNKNIDYQEEDIQAK